MRISLYLKYNNFGPGALIKPSKKFQRIDYRISAHCIATVKSNVTIIITMECYYNNCLLFLCTCSIILQWETSYYILIYEATNHFVSVPNDQITT